MIKKLYKYKRLVLVLSDIFVILFAYFIMSLLRYNIREALNNFEVFRNAFVISVPVYLLAFYFSNVYRYIISHADITYYVKLVFIAMTSASMVILIGNLIGIPMLRHTLVIFAGFIIAAGTCIVRVTINSIAIFLSPAYNTLKNQRVLIIGAGSAAKMLINDIKVNSNLNYFIVGIVDDNQLKAKAYFNGYRVLGNTKDIVSIAEEMRINTILFAIPSADENEKKRILAICGKTNCEIKILPSVDQILSNENEMVKQLKSVEIEDLLERDPIILDTAGIHEEISGKRILVSGGGGSIGSELCRQIIKYGPKKLVILDNYENNAFTLNNELKRINESVDIDIVIATIREKGRLEEIFLQYKPDIIFHAAAHKHVPLMEFSPSEAVKNNIFGTLNMIECADKFNVKKFIFISTDKAVNPTNIMGATKRVCEMLVQAYQQKSNVEFVAVRFGNVLGSNGAVIPLFKKQIAEGGPVTVTHEEVTRYFMTIPEAAQLVLQAAYLAKGGEVFVLDMGKPVKIYDLAEKIIKLSGYTPNVDIKIKVTGLRPGEKLYEELLIDEDNLNVTAHNKIFVEKLSFSATSKFYKDLEELRKITELGNKMSIKLKVSEITGTYTIDVNNQ